MKTRKKKSGIKYHLIQMIHVRQPSKFFIISSSRRHCMKYCLQKRKEQIQTIFFMYNAVVQIRIEKSKKFNNTKCGVSQIQQRRAIQRWIVFQKEKLDIMYDIFGNIFSVDPSKIDEIYVSWKINLNNPQICCFSLAIHSIILSSS